MYNRKGSDFLGRANTPDHAPDHIPSDSPRHHGNRNGEPEQRADRALVRLRDRVRVLDANGHVFSVPGHAPLKATWTSLGIDTAEKPATHMIVEEPERNDPGHGKFIPARPHRVALAQLPALQQKGWLVLGECMRGREPAPDATLDDRHDIGDGITTSRREVAQDELARDAHELHVGEYKTGRMVNAINEGEGVYPERTNDRDMATRVTPRGAPLTFEKPESDG